MEILDINSKDELIFDGSEDDDDAKKLWLEDIAHRIVTRVWQAPHLTCVSDVVDAVVTKEEVSEYIDVRSGDESEFSDNEEDGAVSTKEAFDRVWCNCGKSKPLIDLY